VTHRSLETVNVLDVIPVRLADWEVHDDRVVVIRPRPRVAWYLLPIEWLRVALAVRRIRLDAVGSTAWRACDGARTGDAIVARVRGEFGADAEPVEERLGHLIRRLRREGLLAYRGIDQIRGPEGRMVSRSTPGTPTDPAV
jgi:hypothetical protein